MQGKDWLQTRGIVQNEGQVKTAEWKEYSLGAKSRMRTADKQ